MTAAPSSSERVEQQARFGLFRIALLLLISWIPSVVSMASIGLVSGNSLSSYWPRASDDVIANHQIQTFAVSGFSGGLYTIDEKRPAAAFSRFGPHGPAYPAIYGTLLAPVAPLVSGPVWLHHLLIAAALFVAFLATRSSLRAALEMSLVVATFWPVITMLSTSMQDGLHGSLAILIACAIARADGSPPVRSPAAWMVLVPAVLMRPSWALMLLAYMPRPRTAIGLAGRLAPAAMGAIGAFLLFRYLAAPVPQGIVERLPDMSGVDGVLLALRRILDNVAANGAHLLSFHKRGALEGWFYLASVGVVFLILSLGRADWPVLASLLAFAGLWLAVLAAYDFMGYRAYRVLSAPLLCAILVAMIRARSPRLAAGLLALNLAATPAFLDFVARHRSPLYSDPTEYVALSRALQVLQNSSDDPWCRTILVDTPDISSSHAAIPAGMGISVVSEAGTFPADPRSAYLWRTGFHHSPDPVTFALPTFSITRNRRPECQ
jgi:hypothetical protein